MLTKLLIFNFDTLLNLKSKRKYPIQTEYKLNIFIENLMDELLLYIAYYIKKSTIKS